MADIKQITVAGTTYNIEPYTNYLPLTGGDLSGSLVVRRSLAVEQSLTADEITSDCDLYVGGNIYFNDYACKIYNSDGNAIFSTGADNETMTIGHSTVPQLKLVAGSIGGIMLDSDNIVLKNFLSYRPNNQLNMGTENETFMSMKKETGHPGFDSAIPVTRFSGQIFTDGTGNNLGIRPAVNDKGSIGGGLYHYRTGYINDLRSNLIYPIPKDSDTSDTGIGELGCTSYRWKDAYVNNIYTKFLNGESTDSLLIINSPVVFKSSQYSGAANHFYPSSNNEAIFGHPSYHWKQGYINDLRAYQVLPILRDSEQLAVRGGSVGTATNPWGYGYFNQLVAGGITTDGYNTSISTDYFYLNAATDVTISSAIDVYIKGELGYTGITLDGLARVKAPKSSGSYEASYGNNGQVLMSNGDTVYWGNVSGGSGGSGSGNLNVETTTLSVINKNATLSFGSTSTIASVDGTDIKVTMPAAPSSGTSGNYLSLSGGTMTGGYIAFPNAYGTNNASAPYYVSAGAGYSPTAGKYGVKLVCCDQGDCQSGLGQDLSNRDGGYDLSIVGGTSTQGHGTISFVTHPVNSRSYTTLGYFTESADLYVSRNISASGKITAGGVITAGDKITAPSFYATSDERLKKNINLSDIDYFNLIEKLRLVTYNWKNENNAALQHGVVAQELEKALPEELISHFVNKDDQEYLSVNDSKLVYIALGALQKQIEINKQLEDRLTKLEKLLGV